MCLCCGGKNDHPLSGFRGGGQRIQTFGGAYYTSYACPPLWRMTAPFVGKGPFLGSREPLFQAFHWITPQDIDDITVVTNLVKIFEIYCSRQWIIVDLQKENKFSQLISMVINVLLHEQEQKTSSDKNGIF